MASTNDLVDSKIELVDGSAASGDLSLKRRWLSNLQKSATLIWNDRAWQFKLVEDPAFPFDPAVLNPLPGDFGSFEMLGAGVWNTAPRGAPLTPIHTGEMSVLKHGSEGTRTGIPRYFCVRYYQGPTGPYLQGVPFVELYPNPPAATTLVLSYLLKTPRLGYSSLPEFVVDDILQIPVQWHDLIGWGAEWINKQNTANSSASAEHAIWKAGLEQMRAREACIIRSLEPWRPGRMGR